MGTTINLRQLAAQENIYRLTIYANDTYDQGTSAIFLTKLPCICRQLNPQFRKERSYNSSETYIASLLQLCCNQKTASEQNVAVPFPFKYDIIFLKEVRSMIRSRSGISWHDRVRLLYVQRVLFYPQKFLQIHLRRLRRNPTRHSSRSIPDGCRDPRYRLLLS